MSLTTIMGLFIALGSLCTIASAQSWTAGYPKLHFGSQLLSAASVFPDNFGTSPPKGGVAQDLIFRFSSSQALGETAFTINLGGFGGGDNTWTTGSGDIRCYKVGADGAISAQDSCFTALGNVAAKWESSTTSLSINLRQMSLAVDYAIVLSALSLHDGKGPLPPSCLQRDALLFVAQASSGGQPLSQMIAGFSSVSPIECVRVGDHEVAKLGVAKNSFVIASIGQNGATNSIGSLQTLTVTLASNIDLSSVDGSITTRISLSGLQISQTETTTSFVISQPNGQAIISSTGLWSRETGTLSLSIKNSMTLPARVPLVFSFQLKLPTTATKAGATFVECSTGSTLVIEKMEMTHPSGNEAPMETVLPRLNASVRQSVSGIGQENALSISLKTNFDLRSTATSIAAITISGLVGFANPDSSAQNPIPVTWTSAGAVSGLFVENGMDNQAKWSKATGTLVLIVGNQLSIVSGQQYSLQVTLTNPSRPQTSPTLFISTSGSVIIAATPVSVESGHYAPLFVTTPTFLVSQMGQSSPSVGAKNTITVTLASNVGIQTISSSGIAGVITISGCSGFKEVDGNYPIQNEGFHDITGVFRGDIVAWSQSSATLTMVVAEGKQLKPGVKYVFSFVLTNPSIAQDAPKISISVNGAEFLRVPSMAVAVASGSNSPLLILEPGFQTARIGQDVDGPAMTNLITVTLQANLRLASNVQFTIEGLTNSGTDDTVSLNVGGCTGIFRSPDGALNRGKWSSATGTLELETVIEIADFSNLICSFNVTNPTQSQGASNVFVTVNSRISGQVTNIIRRSMIRNAPNRKAPFAVAQRSFVTAKIGQSSPYPNFKGNMITVTISSNVALATAGDIPSIITISGLTGSTTSSGDLQLFGNDFPGLVGGTGAWDKSAGRLVLTLGTSQRLAPKTMYIFSFNLDNPASGQAGPLVSISASGAQGIASSNMDLDTATCIHGTGDAAPLFVYSPGFLTKDISTTKTSSGSKSALRLTLSSSVALASVPGSLTTISITGLMGFSDASTSSLAISTSIAAFPGTATWDRNTGSLKVSLRENSVISAGVKFVLQFTLTNGVTVSSLMPAIAIQGLSGSVAASPVMLSNDILSPRISYTAPKERPSSLQISFTAQHGISKDDTLVLTLPGVSRSLQDQIWGVSSQPDAFTTDDTEEHHLDSIAAGNVTSAATFRSGWSGKSGTASSLYEGEIGSAIVLDKEDSRLYKSSNVYAGMSIKIEGSSGLHTIYHQSSGTYGSAVAYFFPKYKNGFPQATSVPSQALYEILPQIELISKSDICPGVRVNLTIPQGSGVMVSPSGLKGATLSIVKAGVASAFTVGTPVDIASPSVHYSGSTGRSVSFSLEQTVDHTGYEIFPSKLPSRWYPFVDGHRYISSYKPVPKTLDIFTGYGRVKNTSLFSAPMLYSGSVVQAKLDQRKAISPVAATGSTVWLAFNPASLANMQPQVVRGSIVQLKSELLQFTGDVADRIESLRAPSLTSCRKGQILCGASDSCFALQFTGGSCTDMPSASVILQGGNFSSITIQYRGICTSAERAQMAATYNLVPAPGVFCSESVGNNFCSNGGCEVLWSDEFSILKFQRAMFSSSPAAISTCSEANPCTDKVSPSALYLSEGGSNALQYTSSSMELNIENSQKIRLGYMETMQTVRAGDLVTAISTPQFNGSQCKTSDNIPCSGVSCATISFSGCDLNPAASVVFINGIVSSISIDDSKVRGSLTPNWVNSSRVPPFWATSLCSTESRLLGSIQLAAEVTCQVAPSCGNGCLPSLDKSKDLLLVKRNADSQTDMNGGSLDVVRVHDVRSDIGYQIVRVSETPLESDIRDLRLSTGATVASPVAGTTYTWIDDISGDLIVGLTPSAGISNLRAGYATNADGTFVNYPPTCLQSCNITGIGGFPVGSRQLTVTFDVDNVSMNASVNLSVPTVYNNAAGTNSTPSRRAAPDGHEFRINGDCNCPANSAKRSTICSIRKSGNFQAVLMPVSVCSLPNITVQTTPVVLSSVDSGPHVGTIVGSVIGSVAGVCIIALLVMRCRKAQEEAAKPLPPSKKLQELSSTVWNASVQDPSVSQIQTMVKVAPTEVRKEGPVPKARDAVLETDKSDEPVEAEEPDESDDERMDPIEEGPVFVGRPIPLTPDMMAYASHHAPNMTGASSSNWSYSSAPGGMHQGMHESSMRPQTFNSPALPHVRQANSSFSPSFGVEPASTTLEPYASYITSASIRINSQPAFSSGDVDRSRLVRVDLQTANDSVEYGRVGRVPYGV